MRDYIEERATQLAYYIIEHKATVRQTAKVFNVSKSTAHKDVTARLMEINPELAREARKVLDVNKQERHIRQRQTHKLGNPKPGLKQNIDTIIVFAKMLVTRHKFKKRSFLLSGNRFPCHAVVDYDGGKLKFKWILAYQIIIDGHLKEIGRAHV